MLRTIEEVIYCTLLGLLLWSGAARCELSWTVPTEQTVGSQVVPLPPEEIAGYNLFRYPNTSASSPLLDLEFVAFTGEIFYDDGPEGFCWFVQTVQLDVTRPGGVDMGPFTPEICTGSTAGGCHQLFGG